MAGAQSQAATVADESFASAYHAMRDDPDIQFDLLPPQAQAHPPDWLADFFRWLGKALAPIGRFFHWVGSLIPDAPYARFLLWAMLAVLAAGLLWMLYERLRYHEWHMPRWRRRKLNPHEDTDEWMPDAAPARRWLEEADALAAEERFADAVHHLLIRSIEDIAHRRPQLVRPAVTSRELSQTATIPAGARHLFSTIAAIVEHSLFGGRSVDAGQWQECRAAYGQFAQSKVWKI